MSNLFRSTLLSKKLLVLPLAAMLVALAGCGGKGSSNKDSITGKVTLSDGKPVAGEVIFVFSDGKEGRSPLSADGSYSVLASAKGEAKIGVKGALGTGGPTSGPKADLPGMPAATGSPPPAKYGNPASSGLTYTVKGGEEKHDITLAP